MSLLAFPCGIAPGFDPTQLAARSARFSGVASAGGFINLLNGSPGTRNGTPAAAIKGFGPATNFSSGTDNVTFPFPNTNFTSATQAAILSFNTVGATNQVVMSTDAAGAAGYLILVNSGVGLFAFMGGNISPTFTPVVNAPYFDQFAER
jgi:hypothetical protein